VYVVETVGLLIDQVYYKVFLDHIHLGMFEGGQQFNPVITFGSFQKEVDWIFWVTSAIALAGAIWFARALLVPPERPRHLRRIIEIAVVIAAIGLPAYSSKRYSHINEHPLIGVVREIEQTSMVNVLAARHNSSARPATASTEPVDHDPRLAAFLAAGQPRATPPNVLLIVMESVGAVNLLGPDGLPKESVAPNLARLARQGVVFNSIYTTFPGTTRSQISLHTGGRQVTFGGMSEVLPQFEGPMLPRSMNDLGYSTALFSSERLDGEGTDVFLEHAGYQKFYDFARDLPGHEKRNMIHSWGAREEYTTARVAEWMSNEQASHKPLFLEYLTVATHHPYGAPADYHAPFEGSDPHSSYLNALHYTDRAIGVLSNMFQRYGLLDNTIIIVTGDHGEAFGDLHRNNFLHKNFAYDENVREFTLIWDGKTAANASLGLPLVSSRVGKNGDIMATLLAMLGAPAADIPGRNLLTETFETQVVYFHKLAPPELWGLRDGRWKFIAEIRSNQAELYDLATDPTERNNVAAGHPDKVAAYRDLCQQWYLDSEQDYTLRVHDYRLADKRLLAGDTSLGPRILSTGYKEVTPEHWFVQSSLVNPRQPVIAWTKWATEPEGQASYEWISPDGEKSSSKLENSPEWHVTMSLFPGKLPMETGDWTLRFLRDKNVLLTTHFSVSARAALHLPDSPTR
jgi:arylsulfatase A-like enzyme